MLSDTMHTTHHRIIIGDAASHHPLAPESVDLVVTSPPYPMIQMWDEVFSGQNPSIQKALQNGNGQAAFEQMHQLLDRVWKEVYRVLKFGGFACINIGDAVRTLNDHFMLYTNHARILSAMLEIGFTPLPAVIWRKQTNAPNKFMGSGVLPAGAYVTLEHEYILILRKGGKRIIQNDAEKQLRQRSAIFWEERNQWFSDVWMDLKGTVQKLNDKELRKRSGAFPFELPYRLISMYSLQGDLVLDPFLGMGTTMLAAMAVGRNSVGIELEKQFQAPIQSRVKTVMDQSNRRNTSRLENHLAFINQRMDSGKPMKHRNTRYGFPVITAQEKNLIIPEVTACRQTQEGRFEVDYAVNPQVEFCSDWPADRHVPETVSSKRKQKSNIKKPVQLDLL